ncbi:MAG: carboxypeptidase-like regulatory domain-containing protein [Gemmatimonadetes bacterium]|nr:carboxypeptidase-like regulatory domain-containing protein [Gemmatimonadota bacterium]
MVRPSLPRVLRRVPRLTLLLAVPSVLAAQPRASLQGTVRAAPTDVPLPYAVVTIPALGLERFSGANGRYALLDVPVGQHEVVVRRIGFVPFRATVTVRADSANTLDVRLVQIPVRLAQLTVRPTEPCRTPGLPDSTKFPEAAMLVGLLRENAATYRSLANAHPYTYAQVRALGTLLGDTLRLGVPLAERVDGVRTPVYRPGRVVTTTGNGPFAQTSMALPTLLDLTDPGFIANHCFHYRGTRVADGATLVKLEVRAADRLRSPDVHGTFELDSATGQLRRMALELSRPDRLPSHLREIRAVEVTTTFLEFAPGLSIVDDVCAVNWTRPSGRRARPHSAELQRVGAVRFSETAPPDIPLLQEFPRAPWPRPRALFGEIAACSELGKG